MTNIYPQAVRQAWLTSLQISNSLSLTSAFVKQEILVKLIQQSTRVFRQRQIIGQLTQTEKIYCTFLCHEICEEIIPGLIGGKKNCAIGEMVEGCSNIFWIMNQ